MIRVGPLKLKAQLFCAGERALGPGRADLLEAIDREGSISAAGRALRMSYRYTWLMVDSMNRCFAERLVETTAGGATLTATGRRALGAFRALEETLTRAASESGAQAELAAMMRHEPRPAGHGVPT